MKKYLLLLLISSTTYSQVNFGAKSGIAFIDNMYQKQEFLALNETVYLAGLIEYKGLNVAGEFNIMYYKTTSRKAEVNALVPSLALKYYPVDKFNIKVGFYLNSTNLDYKNNVAGTSINIDNLEVKDTGLLAGMEIIAYKGLFIEAVGMWDVNKSDDIKTKHLLIGLGYKLLMYILKTDYSSSLSTLSVRG